MHNFIIEYPKDRGFLKELNIGEKFLSSFDNFSDGTKIHIWTDDKGFHFNRLYLYTPLTTIYLTNKLFASAVVVGDGRTYIEVFPEEFI